MVNNSGFINILEVFNNINISKLKSGDKIPTIYDFEVVEHFRWQKSFINSNSILFLHIEFN